MTAKRMHIRKHLLILIGMLFVFGSTITVQAETKRSDIERITPQEAKVRIDSGGTWLVCSYEDKKCRDMLIEEALLKSEFEAQLPAIDKEAQIIFYCA